MAYKERKNQFNSAIVEAACRKSPLYVEFVPPSVWQDNIPIITEGYRVDGIALLHKGFVIKSNTSKEGTVNAQILQAPAILGTEAFDPEAEEYQSTIYAKYACYGQRLSVDHFLDAMGNNVTLTEAALKALTEQSRLTYTTLSMSRFTPGLTRAAKTFANLADENGSIEGFDQTELAALAFLTRPTMSMMIQQLVRLGIISKESRGITRSYKLHSSEHLLRITGS